MARTTKSENVPKDLRSVFDSLTAITDTFCTNHLNDEYATWARYLTAALCRKRPSPLAGKKLNIWACGIIYALGFVNFLFDKSQIPHMTAKDLCAAFQVSKSAGAAKAKFIRDAFKMYQLDPHWCLESKLATNPNVWMIEVNGFIIDARYASREIQEIAFLKGLIPYLPEKREG